MDKVQALTMALGKPHTPSGPLPSAEQGHLDQVGDCCLKRGVPGKGALCSPGLRTIIPSDVTIVRRTFKMVLLLNMSLKTLGQLLLMAHEIQVSVRTVICFSHR